MYNVCSVDFPLPDFFFPPLFSNSLPTPIYNAVLGTDVHELAALPIFFFFSIATFCFEAPSCDLSFCPLKTLAKQAMGAESDILLFSPG